MTQIKSFEFRPGYADGIEVMDEKVNEFIRSLKRQGCTNVELKITGLERVVIYTVIYQKS